MQWFYDDDHSNPLILAQQHIQSSHRSISFHPLPKTAMVFFLSGAIEYITEHYDTIVLTPKLPTFLGGNQCIQIKGYDICFIHGGYGGPQAADLMETLHALGVTTVITAGLCGSIDTHVHIGDVIIPDNVYSEDGTSHHYTKDDNHYPDITFLDKANSFFATSFKTHQCIIITMDAIYRQTYFKEAIWRDLGCHGIDMETSVIFCVGAYLHMSVHTILLVSDQHPDAAVQTWYWGNDQFSKTRITFIKKAIAYALQYK